MSHSEAFNQKRMDRCARIANAIMANWQKSMRLDYTVRATQSVNELTLDELRTNYFTVGVGNDLTDLPFLDMLVVFQMIEQQTAALKNRKDKSAKQFTIRYTVKTIWPDEEAVRLLSQMQIETPFDKGKYLRIEVTELPVDPEDDPQTSP